MNGRDVPRTRRAEQSLSTARRRGRWLAPIPRSDARIGCAILFEESTTISHGQRARRFKTNTAWAVPLTAAQETLAPSDESHLVPSFFFFGRDGSLRIKRDRFQENPRTHMSERESRGMRVPVTLTLE
ncbi:hypothetical protein BC834DRAFT_656673 [Gloeopeniophorella convolvens]|nr:hypothetical protein BC834DRAFT_656673 [Gloeopeniophorella convolvens]